MGRLAPGLSEMVGYRIPAPSLPARAEVRITKPPEVIPHGRQILLAIAAPKEVDAALRALQDRAGGPSPAGVRPWRVAEITHRIHILRTGVGKANAAGAAAIALAKHEYAAVISLGFAGALPADNPLQIGQTLLADPCVLADDGLICADSFVTQSDLGFPAVEELGERFHPTPALARALGQHTDRTGPCATVSTCSGTDEAAAEIARRTGALAEDMECAAIGLVAARLGVPFAAVRAISNRTGTREHQGWDIDRAADALSAFVAAL